MSASQFIEEFPRSHGNNALTKADLGKPVVLYGWVQDLRDLGGRQFVDLRDRHGITQLIFKPERDQKLHQAAQKLRSEWVIGVAGVVQERVANGGTINKNIATGEVEVEVDRLFVFNQSEVPPFVIVDNVNAGEDLRLKYRYLDLRRPEIGQRFQVRHRLNQITRNYFDGLGFLELETPYMVKYTPGGARNFMVPSRLSPGCHYALAESPQLYKQLFMLAGMDRYFQITKCFRDEDLRLDRQPEFTQVDVEMSFVNEQDVRSVVEGLVVKLWREILGVELTAPFELLPYDTAMQRYGSDKPDTRFGLELSDLTQLVKQHQGGGVALLASAVEGDGVVKGLRLPAEHTLSRSEADKLEKYAKKELGTRGLARARIAEDGGWTQTPMAKSLGDELRLAINQAMGAQPGDILFFQFGDSRLANTVLGHLRLKLGERFELVPKSQWNFLWVVDFPLFEEDEGGWQAAHHAFTSPQVEHVDWLKSDPGKCKARAYDLVLNGVELGGGSIRIHDPQVQAKVFDALGIGPEEAEAKFGFLLQALKFGAPPHGGIALGMDRLAMLMTGAASLRDVIPFPKTQRGTDLMTGAPTEVDAQQLAEVFIKSIAEK